MFPKSSGIVSEVGTPTRVNGLAVRGGMGGRVVGWEYHGTYQGMSEFFDVFCMNIL